MVDSKTQIAARLITTASDSVDASFASALASRCNSLWLALGVDVSLWVVAEVGVGFWVAMASVVGFGRIWIIDGDGRVFEGRRPSPAAASSGVGRSSVRSSFSEPRPCGKARVWVMKRVATAAFLRRE